MEQQLNDREYKLAENAKIVYILYMVSIAFGLTAIIGVVIAYVNKDDSMPEWLQSHYKYMISTFWKGMLMLVAGVITSVIIVGIFLLIFFTVWIIIRSIKGMKRLDLMEAQPVPDGWMFD